MAPTTNVPCARTALSAALCLLLTACAEDDQSQPPPVTFDQLVNACITSSACGVRRYPRIADCVDAYYNLHRKFGIAPIYDEIFGCLAAAQGDCEAAFACYGSHWAAGRCDTTYEAKCNGDTMLACDTLAGPNGTGLVFSFDCSLAGLSCRTRSGGSFEADCTTGGCSPGERRCDGGRLLSCKSDGNTEVVDCDAQGLVCGETAGGVLDCIGATDEDCDIPPDVFSARCDGSVAVTCVGNKVHREDCSQRPFDTRCETGACVPVGTGCSKDEFNRCDAAKLQYCMDGSWRTVDCGALGLGACVPSATGADCGD